MKECSSMHVLASNFLIEIWKIDAEEMKVALAFEIYTDYKDIKQAFNFFLKS